MEGVLVDVLAEVGIGGVGSTEVNGEGVRKVAVAALARAGSGEDADFERPSGSMFCLCLLGYFCGCTLCYACWREATQADGLSVLDECCSFCSGKFVEVHKIFRFVFCAQRYNKKWRKMPL